MRDLATKLKLPVSILARVLDDVENFYYEYSTYKLDSEGRLRTYSDGTPKKRIISPCRDELNTIQKSIKRNIIDQIPLPVHVQGAVKKRSNITNAKIHQGKKFKLTTDIENFFPSITTRHVFDCFLNHGFTRRETRWLTILTTYKSSLPQGAVTSPGLANLVFLSTDEKLLKLCTHAKISYSRFVDDLSFSSATDFKSLVPEILQIIINEGFSISHRKTKYGTKQLITGLHVHNNYIDVPSKIKTAAQLEERQEPVNKPFSAYLNRVQSTNSKSIRRK